ncbi:hypothetical protein, partial [Streptococcus suis]|uniref:hypothetical protein n=1 Tax=Streptococcus suis TaxID=1307 RepID=UPI001EE0FF09
MIFEEYYKSKKLSRHLRWLAQLLFFFCDFYTFNPLILFKKQKLTYNRFMKLTIEQTKELKTYLKDKTYSPFH